MKLCAPALIYLVFSCAQILFDLYDGLYNTVVVKFVVMIMITILLNALCAQGLGVISWMIVFIPFILMTVIVSFLLYAFGLDIAQGTIKKCGDKPAPPPPAPSSAVTVTHTELPPFFATSPAFQNGPWPLT